ncbi:MAG TPA: hypothetical protein VL181_06860, partial [Holophagaceae bacterium]|nr:hypothetical protein [Holophagaceae bacterium]
MPAPRFIVPPETAAIRSMKVFEDPIVPVGSAPGLAENQALAKAIEQYHDTGKTEAVEPFL